MDAHSSPAPLSQLPPLRRSKKSDKPYIRNSNAESQILRELHFEPDEIIAHAQITDLENPFYIKEEALVFLIRHFHKQRTKAVVKELMDVLQVRSSKKMYKHLRGVPPDSKPRIYHDVLAELVLMILEAKVASDDFLEVLYWVALEKRCLRCYNAYRVGTRKHGPVDRTEAAQQGRDKEEVSTEASIEDKMTAQQFLDRLDEPLRTLADLYYLQDWQIEPKEDNLPTISEYFDVEPRTIRNRLKKLKSLFAEWRKHS
jgi:hypothetical protein